MRQGAGNITKFREDQKNKNMSLETEEWQINFGLALLFLDKEEGKMLQENIFVDIKKLFEWIGKTSKEAEKISPVCNGNYLALTVCDKLDGLENGKEVLQNIINFTGKMGIKSEVNTQSLRYQATVCVSMFLDRKLKNQQTEV